MPLILCDDHVPLPQYRAHEFVAGLGLLVEGRHITDRGPGGRRPGPPVACRYLGFVARRAGIGHQSHGWQRVRQLQCPPLLLHAVSVYEGHTSW